MGKLVKSCIQYMKKEVVLSIAVLLALVSSLFVPPSTAYLGYIDWDTLALLFCLMLVMKGIQRTGAFVFLGNQLLKKTASSRKMLFILVFLPFLFSMAITNDVALITFVPFGITVLRMAKQESLFIPTVVLQTIAANLGSMLTPMGNPQNLYLYGQSGMGFGNFCFLMLPYVLIAAGCLAVLVCLKKSIPISAVTVPIQLGDRRELIFWILSFGICILGIFKMISPLLIAAVLALLLFVLNRRLLLDIDYSLLGTFFAFFIFIGNIGSMDGFRNFLMFVLTGHVTGVSILASQVISNVPAALLLSGFTAQWDSLIVGCNLGGLGTLIASMASLISYKMAAKEYPGLRKKYFLWFTLCNVGFLLVLLLMDFLFLQSR